MFPEPLFAEVPTAQQLNINSNSVSLQGYSSGLRISLKHVVSRHMSTWELCGCHSNRQVTFKPVVFDKSDAQSVALAQASSNCCGMETGFQSAVICTCHLTLFLGSNFIRLFRPKVYSPSDNTMYYQNTDLISVRDIFYQ